MEKLESRVPRGQKSFMNAPAHQPSIDMRAPYFDSGVTPYRARQLSVMVEEGRTFEIDNRTEDPKKNTQL